MVLLSSMGNNVPHVVTEVNNSRSMVSVSYSGNHAPPVFMKVEQKLEHGPCHF